MTLPAAIAKTSRHKAGAPGRPKDPSKGLAILEAAKRLFTQRGLAVSMDQIAAEAGVSKLTVYSHFGDKDSLFLAAVRAKCEEVMPVLYLPASRGALRSQLTDIGRAFFSLVTSDESLSMQRMMLSGSGDPHTRSLFWDVGPKQLKDAFTDFLQSRIEAGDLDIPDLTRATEQFFCLLKGEPHMRMLSGLCTAPDPGEIGRHIDASIDLFLRAYGRR